MYIPNKSYKIKRPPSEKEWQSINIFKERASDYIKERDKICPKHISVSAKGLDCGEFSGDSNIPKPENLKLFYLAFRFLF